MLRVVCCLLRAVRRLSFSVCCLVFVVRVVC